MNWILDMIISGPLKTNKTTVDHLYPNENMHDLQDL